MGPQTPKARDEGPPSWRKRRSPHRRGTPSNPRALRRDRRENSSVGPRRRKSTPDQESSDQESSGTCSAVQREGFALADRGDRRSRPCWRLICSYPFFDDRLGWLIFDALVNYLSSNSSYCPTNSSACWPTNRRTDQSPGAS